MNKIRVAAWVLAALVLSSCTGFPPETRSAHPVSLENTTWVLQRLHGQPLLANSTVTMNWEADQLSGSAGCNRYFASYEAQDDRITIGPAGMTRMYCLDPEGLMEQEQAFVAALSTVVSYRVTADRLEMLDAAGQVVLASTPPPPLPDTVLKDTEWVLTTWLDGGTATAVLDGAEITLRFSQGTANGLTGCNSYGGPYTQQGNTLRISRIMVTEMYCQEPAGIMEQEARYIRMLSEVATFEIDAYHLTLHTADGRGLIFSAR